MLWDTLEIPPRTVTIPNEIPVIFSISNIACLEHKLSVTNRTIPNIKFGRQSRQRTTKKFDIYWRVRQKENDRHEGRRWVLMHWLQIVRLNENCLAGKSLFWAVICLRTKMNLSSDLRVCHVHVCNSLLFSFTYLHFSITFIPNHTVEVSGFSRLKRIIDLAIFAKMFFSSQHLFSTYSFHTFQTSVCGVLHYQRAPPATIRLKE